MSYSMQALTDPTGSGSWWFGVGGMAELRDRMRAAGVLDEETPMPLRPAEDEAALLAWRSQRSPNPGKVPAWKFSSNDGWVVTPEECALLVEGLSSGEGSSTHEFVDYCAACIYKGGFQVW